MTDRELIERMLARMRGLDWNTYCVECRGPMNANGEREHTPECEIGQCIAAATARLAEQPLGRFGHHPDREAIAQAKSFRVGGAPSSVRAKQILRELESEAAEQPQGAQVGEHVDRLEVIRKGMHNECHHRPLCDDCRKSDAAIDAAIAALRQPSGCAGDVGFTSIAEGCHSCGVDHATGKRPRILPNNGFLRCERCNGSYGPARAAAKEAQ
jgi:hypothetical protein